MHKNVRDSVKTEPYSVTVCGKNASSFVRVMADIRVDDAAQLRYHVNNHRDGLRQHAQHTFINDTFISDICQVT